MAKKWTFNDRAIAIGNYKEMPIAQIAKELDRNPDTVNNWLRTHGYRKCPNYTEMEIYLLLNFSFDHCHQIIKHKSRNALKIKQWRLKNAQRKPISKGNK